ncbi:MAG: hypothetical protein V2A73_00415 [Pseudomonadota bacterium]
MRCDLAELGGCRGRVRSYRCHVCEVAIARLCRSHADAAAAIDAHARQAHGELTREQCAPAWWQGQCAQRWFRHRLDWLATTRLRCKLCDAVVVGRMASHHLWSAHRRAESTKSLWRFFDLEKENRNDS